MPATLLDTIKKRWLVLTVAGALGVLALVFTFFGGSEVTELISTGPKDPVVAAQSAEILALLNDLKRLSFDEALFNDPRFQSLVDFSVEIAPQPKGRRNPFLPLGVTELVGQSTSTKSSTVPAAPVPAAAGTRP
jgi:hypothetical protein